MVYLWGATAGLLAYLVGSIPTAYLLVRLLRGVDIRQVGSGNVGATNAARVLGLRFFPVVFLIDLAKGLAPTLALPQAAERLHGGAIAGLPVLVAVGAIVGHNFPIFLGFRGGKGVATSLGAVTALDPWASLAAGLAFAMFLLVTRIVSLSSMLAALVFAAAYFGRVEDAWSPAHWAMSGATIALLVLLVARHRANLVRLARGTEPRIRFRRQSNPRAGTK